MRIMMTSRTVVFVYVARPNLRIGDIEGVFGPRAIIIEINLRERSALGIKRAVDLTPGLGIARVEIDQARPDAGCIEVLSLYLCAGFGDEGDDDRHTIIEKLLFNRLLPCGVVGLLDPCPILAV
ncbi:hypothetical protein D3C87_1809860 [compost metagenome]